MIFGELSQNGGGDTAVPGENLLVGTRNMTGNTFLYDNKITTGYYNGFKTINSKRLDGNIDNWDVFTQEVTLKPETEYTFSFIAKGSIALDLS